MTENNKSTNAADIEAEFAYVVIKQKDGRISIGNLDDAQVTRQPTVDDIYASLAIIKRDLELQQHVGAIVQVLTGAQKQDGPAQTESGLYVPPNASSEAPKAVSKFKKVSRVS